MSALLDRDEVIFNAWIDNEYTPALDILTNDAGMSINVANTHICQTFLAGHDIVADAKALATYSRDADILPFRSAGDCE